MFGKPFVLECWCCEAKTELGAENAAGIYD